MITKALVKGLLTYLPGVLRFAPRKGTGGTDSAVYCYAVWLKHLALLGGCGMRSVPDAVGELGPGDSIGVGLAALLSGASHYVALDVVRYASNERNALVLDGLLKLFRTRAPRPLKGWPDTDSLLDASLFPSAILDEAMLSKALDPARVAAIRGALREPGKRADGICIEYAVPWTDMHVQQNHVGLVLSHSALEHVVDLQGTYLALNAWLDERGWMSHQIDYSSHGLTRAWNGHWSIPRTIWRLIVGRRSFLINRAPHSTHLALLRAHGFEIEAELQLRRDDGLVRHRLAEPWCQLSDADLHCAGGYVAARRCSGSCQVVDAAPRLRD
jgi:hypothetical protein